MWQETQAIYRNTPNRPMSHFRGGQSIRKTLISCGTFTYYSDCVYSDGRLCWLLQVFLLEASKMTRVD